MEFTTEVIRSHLVPPLASHHDDARTLLDRRAAIDALVFNLEQFGAHPDLDAVATTIHQGLSDPLLADLGQLRGGEQRLITQSFDEFERFLPSAASNASTPAGMVRILLLQNLDLLWWGDDDEYETDASITADSDLVDLRKARRAGATRFAFGVAPATILGRARDFAVQRAMPRRQPSGPGLAITKVRPEMLNLLNEINDTVAETAPAGTPPIWVTSVTRSVAYQNHLRSLGFSALLPSAHCRGWAADIEVAWFAQFDAQAFLTDTLLRYLDAGILNVIDEGRAWHICLNPAARSSYESN